jgi:hypothetical protein
MVAVAGVPLTHVPPPGSVNVIVAPAHTADGPLMGDGRALTVIVFIT